MIDICFERTMGYNDRRIMLVGIPLAGIMVSLLLFSPYILAGDWPFLMICIPIAFLYSMLMWLGLRVLYVLIVQKFPKISQIGYRATWLILGVGVLYLIIGKLVKPILGLFISGVHEMKDNVIAFPATLTISLFVLTVYEAISFYLQLDRTTAEKINLEKSYVASQLEGLRNQVNPHFLFNSLNTLSFLIPEDPDRALRFVLQLSKVYRYVLESRDNHVIPLQEELNFLNSYIFLLKERFGDSLQIEMKDIDNSEDIAIVPLSLQLLFENAIKHNIISKDLPLSIKVYRNNDSLIVRNNLQIKNQVTDSTGVGIENIRARYGMLTEKPVFIEPDANFFTVHLPIITLSKAEI